MCPCRKFLTTGRWLYRGPFRRPPDPFTFIPLDRPALRNDRTAATLCTCFSSDLPRDVLPGYGQWRDFSGCAAKIPVGGWHAVRRDRSSRRTGRFSLAILFWTLKRGDRDVCRRLRRVCDPLRSDDARSADLSAPGEPSRATRHLTPKQRYLYSRSGILLG